MQMKLLIKTGHEKYHLSAKHTQRTLIFYTAYRPLRIVTDGQKNCCRGQMLQRCFWHTYRLPLDILFLLSLITSLNITIDFPNKTLE